MGQIQIFRERARNFRSTAIISLAGGLSWGVDTMYPELMPELAWWVTFSCFIGLLLIGVDFIDVKLQNRPVGKFGYVPAGFNWLRNKIGRAVAEATNEPRFISRQDAVDKVYDSKWARGRKRENAKSITLSEAILHGIGTIDPKKTEENAKFLDWCRLALKKFVMDNNDAVRGDGASIEYNESILQSWLETQYEDDLVERFGRI